MVAAAAVPYIVAAVGAAGSIATGVRASKQQKAEGESRQNELNAQADQEKVAAIDREGQRRRRLNQLLGTTIAETGARGIAFEGSPQAIAAAEITQADLAESGAKVSDLSQISTLRRQGLSARRSGQNRAAGTLLKSGASAVSQLVSA